MKQLIVLILFLLGTACYATNIDSLRAVVKTSKNDSLRLDANNKLIWQYLFSDSEKAKLLIQKSERIASKEGQEYGRTTLFGIKAIYFDLASKKDSALFYFRSAHQLAKEHEFVVQENHALGNLGMYYWNQGDKHKALRYFFTAVKQSEKIKDKKYKDQSNNYNNIGLVYQELSLEGKALKYHKKALSQRLKNNNLQGIASSYNNIGICYKNLNELKTALIYFEKGEEYAKQTNDLHLVYQLIGGKASVMLLEGKVESALSLFKESLNRPDHVPMNNNDRVSILSNIAHAYVLLQEADSSLFYSDWALRTQDENFEVKINYPELYQWKGQAYFLKGDVKLGTAYLDTFTSITLQKFNDKSAKYLQELEVEFESEKREKKLAEKQIEIQKRNNIILLISALLVITCIIFLQYYLRKSAKNKKLLLEKELSQARLEIEAKEQLYSQRLEISRDLHDNIGSQLTFISSSVDQLERKESFDESYSEKLENLRFFIKQVFQELRDTVWAMNQASITGEDLHERIIRLVEQVNLSQAETRIQLKVESNSLSAFELSSKACVNLLAIVKEALNNAVKHANSKEIKLMIDVWMNQLEVVIIDNGKGFNSESQVDGFGLENMRRRAKSIGGEFDLKSSERGTEIRIKLQKNKLD